MRMMLTTILLLAVLQREVCAQVWSGAGIANVRAADFAGIGHGI